MGLHVGALNGGGSAVLCRFAYLLVSVTNNPIAETKGEIKLKQLSCFTVNFRLHNFTLYTIF